MKDAIRVPCGIVCLKGEVISKQIVVFFDDMIELFQTPYFTQIVVPSADVFTELFVFESMPPFFDFRKSF